MLSKNSKNSKKDKLEGAIGNELSSEGIMSAFVGHVQDDKTNGNFEEKSSTSKESPRDSADNESRSIKKSEYSKSLPMIRNPNKKEWWISLSAFFTVIALVLILFTGPCEKTQVFNIKLSSSPLDSSNITSLTDTSNFSIGTPVYFYFGSTNALNINKVFIYVENLNPNISEMKISTIESNINPNWKSIETYFQKEFFENPGKYKITVQNSEKKVLAEKIFYIR
jgi:hypothetical protein